MIRSRRLVAAVFVLAWSLTTMPAARAASDIAIAASVAPVHSLVASVTEGIAEPSLIVRPGVSPHDHALKPSEASALDRADLVFWVGEGLERWMAKAVTTLAGDAVVVELGAVEGLTRHPVRGGGLFADHGHADHHHGDHDGAVDPHLWLDPDNAKVWLDVIADALIAADPDHAEAYRANARAAVGRLDALSAEIEQMLAGVGDKPFVVFHDAYQYFERRFGLHPLGAVSLGDADRPGPARIVAIRDAIAESGAVCIFAEPQFEPKLIETVIEGSEIRSGLLDPIGAGQQPGATLYPQLLRNLATSLRDCLG